MAAPPFPTLKAEGLVRRFGDRTAVDGMTFRFTAPIIVGLVGPNGSGKTTLIRMLLGLLSPTEGRVRLADQAPRRAVASGHVAVGYMPQREALYEDLTVRQNLAFFARIQRVPRAERAARIEDALRVVDLSDRAGDRVARLSGGMRRRASLACALVHRPGLVALDEPTVGVDPALRSAMWDAFARLRDAGSVLLVSTHYLGEAERCDLVLLMRRGRVLAADAPARLKARTRTRDLESAFLSLVTKEAAP